MASPDFLNINSMHLQFLTPLNKWRILDLKNLREEIDYPLHPSGFEKTIRRLEKAKILGSFRDPWSRRKFVYLSENGEMLVNDSGRKIALSNETFLHDAKVSEFTKKLLETTFFTDVILEHQIREVGKGEVPDARLTGERKGVAFSMAFELEITRKSKDRIKAKINRYLQSDYYDYVLYLFCSKPIWEGYRRFIQEEFGERGFQKVMLFWNPTILSKKIDPNEGIGYFKSKEVKFDELF